MKSPEGRIIEPGDRVFIHGENEPGAVSNGHGGLHQVVQVENQIASVRPVFVRGKGEKNISLDSLWKTGKWSG